MLTRRRFLRRSIEAGLIAASPVYLGGPLAGCSRAASSAGESSDLLVNHVGFSPGAGKFCVLAGTQPVAFSVVAKSSSRVVRQGTLTARAGDFGQYLLGDFSDLKEAGTYEIRIADRAVGAFSIAADVYSDAVNKCTAYFAKQRCGDSQTGHHAPCHLDDGRRSDNGKHQDTTGGWHDACDLRKWVDATIYGMIGLSRVLDVLGPKRVDRDRIIDELRWGNTYFRKLQEPDGYVMDYCGGDDGNHYTDNQIGTSDDRAIRTEPCALPAQFHFIAAQAAMARHTRDRDPAYATDCEKAATRCLDWCVNHRSPGAANSLAAGILACVELHRATGEARLKDQVGKFCSRLIGLQVNTVDGDSPTGFFNTAPDRPEPMRDIQNGNLPLIAICEAIEQFKDHEDLGRWRAALLAHCNYLSAMASRSVFGTVPFGLYIGNDPGGARRIGRYWYRWFMRRRDETPAADWWVGTNAHLASNGVGLARAARIMRDASLASLAQRQLDWVLGVNPFNASWATDIGRNQPRLYSTGQFRPPTPLIPGGVMNGMGGDDADRPVLEPGSWNTCEYWTPMVAYVMWLLAEQQAASPSI